MSLLTSYWILQNTRVMTFTVSELLRENQQSGKITQTRLGLSLILKYKGKIVIAMTDIIDICTPCDNCI